MTKRNRKTILLELKYIEYRGRLRRTGKREREKGGRRKGRNGKRGRAGRVKSETEKEREE